MTTVLTRRDIEDVDHQRPYIQRWWRVACRSTLERDSDIYDHRNEDLDLVDHRRLMVEVQVRSREPVSQRWPAQLQPIGIGIGTYNRTSNIATSGVATAENRAALF